MTRIADLLAAGPTWSFEFFPPKTPEGMASFDRAVADLAALDPSFVSITYGAWARRATPPATSCCGWTPSSRSRRCRTSPASAHRRAELVELLEGYRDHGVHNVLALAGDPPEAGEADGDFTYATELVELIREVGDFSVGVAAFPEVHPRSPDRASDRRHLADKLALADFGMTQFFSTSPTTSAWSPSWPSSGAIGRSCPG
jgi:methylenetetrahydrofolate reductase (NADPH)